MKPAAVSLNQVLRYRNADVIDRYLKDFGGTRPEAGKVFRGMLRWLYLVYRSNGSSRAKPVQCFVTSDLAKIDDMWHTFILFTSDYFEFCDRYFGRYIHHQPTTGREAAVSKTQLRELYRRFYELVYDVLGDETFRDWFVRGSFKQQSSRNGNGR